MFSFGMLRENNHFFGRAKGRYVFFWACMGFGTLSDSIAFGFGVMCPGLDTLPCPMSSAQRAFTKACLFSRKFIHVSLS